MKLLLPLAAATTRVALFLILVCIPAAAGTTTVKANGGHRANVNNHACNLFLTSGFPANHYAFHRFYDFTDIITSAASDTSDDAAIDPRTAGVAAVAPPPPDVISNPDLSANGNFTSSYFISERWTTDWVIQVWSKPSGSGSNSTAPSVPSNASADGGGGGAGSMMMINSANNVYIASDDEDPSGTAKKTHLTLRTARLDDFQTAAEIDSTMQDYMFLSIRFAARVRGGYTSAVSAADDEHALIATPAMDTTQDASGSPGSEVGAGACAGMFTYHRPNSSDNSGSTSALQGSVQESDIEILTSDPSASVHFTNQPSTDAQGDPIIGATENATITIGAASNTGDRSGKKGRSLFDRSQWNIYRMDWTPLLTAWFVNGISVANTSINVPRDPMGIVVNMWSDGGSWTGQMSAGQEALLQIRWIEVVFNATGEYNQSNDDVGPEGSLVRRQSKRDDGQVVCVVGDGLGSITSESSRSGSGWTRMGVFTIVGWLLIIIP